MTQQHYPADSVSPAMVAEHFTSLARKKNDVILKMAEEIVSLNQELERLRGHNEHLQMFMDSHGGAEVWEQDKAMSFAKARVDELNAQKSSLIAEIPELENKFVTLTLGLEDFAHPATSYTELKTDLRELRSEMKTLSSSGLAVDADENELLPTAAGKVKQLKKNIARLALRCFNAEVENIIKSVTAKNVQSSADKIGKAADAISRLTKPLDISISYEYQRLKGQELEIAGQVEQAREIEKEEQRAMREALREQAQAEAEMEAKKKALLKERKHFENVLARIQATGDSERIAEIQAELEQIDAGIADVDYRKANTRAGYVYVISNIGSFGQRMVKIGMTRRLDPMDRVRELGDASVPFGFDVHALFFTEDAVDVEHQLHEAFAKQRVNRVNLRREFFYATPAEVHAALDSIAGDVLEFNEEAEAEQYYTSLQIAEADSKV
ncbi:DUF4041 domain-containing protein [Rothia aerolata]|uniref:Bacteriophage T5 Orf172 DNA-binding domain-containing protein n=1 Tax=Rothia aerolata TaxID=1812262 RepID=A0A917IMT1_9MICC|nr:DUF4041 domain-containing protein [Rothia aerolata]GGH58465.1 hypothetical protein GCM10007359_04680 [Rothia aerolata]